MKRILILITLTVACFAMTACSDWERTAFQTLSASKATIDGAQSAYEARTIPHTECVFGIINKAKAAQTLAVDAMMTYETAKESTGSTAAQNVVTTDLEQLAPIVASIGTLGSATCSATVTTSAVGHTNWPMAVTITKESK